MPVDTANDASALPTRPPLSRLIAGFVIAGALFGAASSWAGTTTWSIIDNGVVKAIEKYTGGGTVSITNSTGINFFMAFSTNGHVQAGVTDFYGPTATTAFQVKGANAIDFSVDQAPANAAVNGHGSSKCGPPRRI